MHGSNYFFQQTCSPAWMTTCRHHLFQSGPDHFTVTNSDPLGHGFLWFCKSSIYNTVRGKAWHPGVITPYTKVGHRRVLKFQKDPYFARFQGQFLKNYHLFRVKTRTILLSKIPLFLPIQGHFQKIPLFVQKQHRNNTGSSPLPAQSIARTWVLLRLISLETSERLRLFLHFYNSYTQISFDTHNSVRYLCHL